MMINKEKQSPLTIFFPGSERDVFSDVPAEGIRYVYFDDGGQGRSVIFRENDSGQEVLIEQITTPWRMFFTRNRNENLVVNVHTFIEQNIGGSSEAALLIEEGSSSDVLSAINQFIAQEYGALLSEHARSLITLSEIRNRHEDLQNRFARLEGYIQKIGISPIALLFENLPLAQTEFSLNSGEGFYQLLPVSSQGLSVLQIHTGTDASEFVQSDSLRFTVETIEEKRVLAEGFLSAVDVYDGWATIPVVSDDEISRSVRLVIQNDAERQSKFLLGTGRVQALNDYRPRHANSGTPLCRSSLALRCWYSAGGSNLTVLRSKQTELAECVREPDRIIAPTSLSAFRHLATGWAPDFPPVCYHADEGALECHPPPVGATVGHMQLPSLGVASRISANCFIKGEQSRDIAFRMLVLDGVQFAHMRSRGPEYLDAADDNILNSGWTVIGVNQSCHLSVLCTKTDCELYLVVMTCMATEGDNSHAWARYNRFTVASLGLNEKSGVEYLDDRA